MVKLKSRSTNGLPKSLVEVVVVELQAHERSEKRHIDEVINSRRYCCIWRGIPGTTEGLTVPRVHSNAT